MRSLTTAALAALAAGTVAPVYLVALQFDSGTKYCWTGIGTVVWNSQDWEGMGDLLGVSAITQTASLSSESTTISLSGLNSDDVSSVMSDVSTLSTADVYLGFLDLSTSAIIVDPDHCFSGHLDVPTLQDDGQRPRSQSRVRTICSGWRSQACDATRRMTKPSCTQQIQDSITSHPCRLGMARGAARTAARLQEQRATTDSSKHIC